MRTPAGKRAWARASEVRRRRGRATPAKDGRAALPTVKEAAAFLRIGRNMCYELVRQGQIPHVRLGRLIRVPRSRLRAWIARQTGYRGPPDRWYPSIPNSAKEEVAMQGHIRRRGKGSWTVVVDLGRDPDSGKRRQLWRTVHGRKKDAESVPVQILHQKSTGVDAPPGRMTVAEYLQRWLTVYAFPNTAPTTSRRYEQLIRVHLVPTLGNLPLTKLRPLHIQDAYQRILGAGLSARTALQCHRVLREALQHALQWQILARNPADAVEAPRPGPYEVPALSPEQVRRVIASAEQTPYGALVHTAVMTGLRLGELLGLRWQDVDLDAGLL